MEHQPQSLTFTSVERRIIIFMAGLIFNIVMNVLIQIWPFKLHLSSVISPVGATTIEAHVSERLAHIPIVDTFFTNVQTKTLPLTANAYIVVDQDTKNILLEKNMNQKVSIASVTKIMTAIVALDLADPSDEFIVSEQASKIIPTKIGVVPGEKMNLKELLYAVLLTSANDAAEVIKEGVNAQYGTDVFVKAMNTKASLLNLTNTHYQNPQGFDSTAHYSSAFDLAVLTTYALENYPLIAEIVDKPYAYLPETSGHKQFDLLNWNGLLGVYPGVSGVKIGNTDRAGKTTVVTSTRNNKHILAVVLGTESIYDRDEITAQLLDEGFAMTIQLPPIAVTKQQLQEKYNSWQTYPRDYTVN